MKIIVEYLSESLNSTPKNFKQFGKAFSMLSMILANMVGGLVMQVHENKEKLRVIYLKY